MKKYFLMTALVASTPLFGALPPLYQSMREYEELLTHEEFSRHLSSDQLITSINRNEKGFDIVTNKCTLHVDVIYKPSKMPGPAQFDLQFQEAVCEQKPIKE